MRVGTPFLAVTKNYFGSSENADNHRSSSKDGGDVRVSANRLHRWSRFLYPASMLLFSVCTTLQQYTRRFAHVPAAVSPSPDVMQPPPAADVRTLWDDVVTHPILTLFLVLGFIHALELSQRITLPLLRDLRRKIARIVRNSEKHNQEIELIFGSLFKRPIKRDAGSSPDSKN